MGNGFVWTGGGDIASKAALKEPSDAGEAGGSDIFR